MYMCKYIENAYNRHISLFVPSSFSFSTLAQRPEQRSVRCARVAEDIEQRSMFSATFVKTLSNAQCLRQPFVETLSVAQCVHERS